MVFQNVEAAEPENLTMDGVHAQKYVYSADLGEFSYKIMQTASIRSGSVYLITYTSLADTYESHLEEVNNMISFFRFH